MADTAPQVAVEPNLNPDTYGNHQPDSAYDSEVASYTTSLATEITNYKYEHGRRYHAYKEGSYVYPNDEKESERLDIMHKMIERILDIGTGTGIWAMEMGDLYPDAEILGNDLSPIQPRWVPPNVRFEIDDVEEDWQYHQKFDFIHCRCMGNALKDWPRLVKQCYEFTTSGGYTEFIDLDLTWVSPDGSLTKDHASKKFNNAFLDASRAANMEPNPGPLLEGWAKDAGFVDIVSEKLVCPVGTWPADKHLKEIGAWNYLQIMEGLEAFTFALFTRVLGMSREECEVACALIRKEIKDPKMHVFFHVHVCYGRKP